MTEGKKKNTKELDIEIAREEIAKVLKGVLEAPPSAGDLLRLKQRRTDVFITEFIRILDKPSKAQFIERIASLLTDLENSRMELLTSELLKLVNEPEKMEAVEQLAKGKV